MKGWGERTTTGTASEDRNKPYKQQGRGPKAFNRAPANDGQIDLMASLLLPLLNAISSCYIVLRYTF